MRFIKILFYFLPILILIYLPACADSTGPSSQDVHLIDSVVDVPEDTYEEDCYRTQYWFCPPHNAVWQKPVVVDICVDPPRVISVGECVELFECDPTIFLQGEEDCTTDEGFPGTRKKYCNKGTYQYGDCVSPCSEEICDGIDNDCDDLIDEGQENACGTCGIPPSETCDNVDNNCNGSTDEDLVQECFTACGVGVEYCAAGNWISCTAAQPQEEVCDGLDNNCNGKIDEGLNCACTINDIGALFPCSESPLLCGEGYKSCACSDPQCTEIITTPCYASCHYFPSDEFCDPQIGQAIEDEICNNFDDNCNQLIDEDLFAGCYTGPNETEGVGTCIAGEVYCKSGLWGNDNAGEFTPNFCSGEVVPAKEDHCNGADENCDGIIDDGKELQESDVLFIVDWSASMDVEISAVSQALALFAAHYSDEEVILWGLIKGPVVDLFLQKLMLITDFVPFTEFSKKISPAFTSVAGSKEMLLDALYFSLKNITTTPPYADIGSLTWPNGITSDPAIQDFSMSWREDSNKVIIIFTDEIAQTFLSPPAHKDIILAAASGVKNIKIYVFTPDQPTTKASWENISSATGGKWFKLTYEVLPMYFGLVEILDENICE